MTMTKTDNIKCINTFRAWEAWVIVRNKIHGVDLRYASMYILLDQKVHI